MGSSVWQSVYQTTTDMKCLIVLSLLSVCLCAPRPQLLPAGYPYAAAVYPYAAAPYIGGYALAPAPPLAPAPEVIPEAVAYVHDTTGDVAEPYVHDPTGDTDPNSE